MNGKNILLCVTGGIAVYKAVALTSKLTQLGANVRVMMSENASKFVTPLSFQAISRNDVYTDTFDEKDSSKIAHIDLADWPDLILVVPATANIIGKLANGLADNMISTTILASIKPVWIAPAMNVHMYENRVVQENMNRLKSYGYHFIEPGAGYLACGYVGKGRLEEPENIARAIQHFFQNENRKPLLSGKKVVITAGPTRERIDPVRYLSNFSTGKMGYAIAQVAIELGADVTLISGPVNLQAPNTAKLVQIESAKEMYDAVLAVYSDADIVIKTAAVADYQAEMIETKKMKKSQDQLNLKLIRTKDILQELGKRKTHQILVGFAAETNDVDEYAKKKLINKNADFIIGNNVTKEGAGFGTDTNIVTIYSRDNKKKELPLLSKREVAYEIFKVINQELKGRDL